ncbi:MAG: restriction endonuclease subunit S [Ferruginibacter sp.]|nr:restriction endonuclease subunit S [Bacteroidota bacterium]MBX2920221.1 restriction endonuclease subunit S [Ferruginibacter sp.]
MMFPQIRCYQLGALAQPNVFFILAKGENAGKPSLKPWVNSFVVICSNEKYFRFYFWLVYALFKAKKFKIRLRGTAIPFINKADIADTLKEVAPAVYEDWSKFQELLNTLDKLELLKSSLGQQLLASENLQSYLLHKYFTGRQRS